MCKCDFQNSNVTINAEKVNIIHQSSFFQLKTTRTTTFTVVFRFNFVKTVTTFTLKGCIGGCDADGSAVRFGAAETQTSGAAESFSRVGWIKERRAGAELHGGDSFRGTNRPLFPLHPPLSRTHAKLMLTGRPAEAASRLCSDCQ